MLKPKTQINNLLLKMVHALVMSLDSQIELESEELYREKVSSDNQYFHLFDTYFGPVEDSLRSEIHDDLFNILQLKVKELETDYSNDPGDSADLLDWFIKKYSPLLVTV